jgi:hypothetical protein
MNVYLSIDINIEINMDKDTGEERDSCGYGNGHRHG